MKRLSIERFLNMLLPDIFAYCFSISPEDAYSVDYKGGPRESYMMLLLASLSDQRCCMQSEPIEK